MVEQFFPGGGGYLHLSRHNSITLLSGPPSCGKTSLLFQLAFNAATATPGKGKGDDVVFICNRRKLEFRPPYLSLGVDPASDTFDRIQIKYVDDDEGVKKYFAAFHMHESYTFPSVVIIDDFADFFDQRTCQERYGNPRGRELAMVRVLALCHNALFNANEKGCCKLLLSDTQHGDSPRLLFIYKRWVSSIFTIKGDGKGSFLLRNTDSTSEGSDRPREAKYSIALQYIHLEGIIDHDDSNT